MKELSIEEKAKRYDEALERAKKLYNDGNSPVATTVEAIFLELKENESEDERIRKEIINYIKRTTIVNFIGKCLKKQSQRWLEWLEKQGEQKQDPCANCKDVMLNCHNFPCIKKRAFKQGKTALEAIIDEKVDNANKVEPKFHEGDIIIHKELGGDYIHNPHKIIQVDILDKKYRLEGGLVAHFGEQDDYELVEQKPKFRVGDTIKCKYDDRQFTIESVDLEKGTYIYTKKGCSNDIDYADEEFELVKQNHTDKVEPKFKVGDWVVSDDKDVHDDYRVCKITKIDDGRYYIEGGGFLSESSLAQYEYRLWTIEDAKNGDVLKALPIGKLGGHIFIFKGVSNRDYAKNCIDFHCRVYKGCFHAFENGYMGVTEHSEDIRPATDEERDLLFIKMKEAGYEWDADKKELKKVEQKPTNNQFTPEQASVLDKHIDKFVGQNHGWSEEDYRIFSMIVTDVNLAHDVVRKGSADKERDRELSWLDFLRDRVQIQDITYYNPYKEVVESIAEMCKHYDKGTDLQDFYDNVKVKCKDAKEYDSLYPQSTWKPSEKQMDLINEAIGLFGAHSAKGMLMMALRNDLKKL